MIAEDHLSAVRMASRAALRALQARDWHGLAGEIARTGEEDPLALVDDPDLRAVIAVKMELRRSQEAEMFSRLDPRENAFGQALVAFDAAAWSDDDRSTTERTALLASVAGEVQIIIGNLEAAASRDQEIARLFLLAKFHDLAEPLVAQPD